MPEYTVIFERIGSEGKKGETNTVFAPSVNDAWVLAKDKLPKKIKILDIVRSHDYSNLNTIIGD
jgi:hypothetical protein